MIIVSVLVALVLMLLLGKLFGDIVHRLGFAPLIGQMFAGILLGPMCINIVTESGQADLDLLFSIAILFMMFVMGLSIDIEKIMGENIYKASLLTAMGGCSTFLATTLVSFLLGLSIEQSLIIGVAFISTSAAIGFLVFQNIGDKYSKVFKTIMAVGVTDDILAIIGLSLFMSFITTGVDIGSAFKLFLLVIGFIIFVLGFGKTITDRLINYSKRSTNDQSIISFSLILLFLVATLSESVGIAQVTGAFFAGTILARSHLSYKIIVPKIEAVSEGLFVPIFFVYTGMRINVFEMFQSSTIDLMVIDVPVVVVLFLGLLMAVMLCKYMMTYIGSKILGGFRDDESHKMALAMMPMGEYTLVIGGIGVFLGILDTPVFSALAMVVLMLSIITPIMLRKAYAH